MISHKKLLPAAAAEQELKTHQVSIPRLAVQSSLTMKSVPSQSHRQYLTRLDGKKDSENPKPRTPLPLPTKDTEERAPLGSKDDGAWIEWEENTPESENESRDEEGGFGKRIGRVDKIGSRLGGFL
jgi:hypothetical protein